MKNYLQLNLSLLYWILIAPFTGQFFKIAPIFKQMVAIGVRATPMVALTAFSVGVTLAMQAAHSLESLGAEMYIPDLVMLTLLREMGPVLIAVIVIGRSVAADVRKRPSSRPLEQLEETQLPPQLDSVDEILSALVVREALDSLSQAHQQVLMLAEAGLTQSQIATQLGLPLGTVKTRIFHGLRALRSTLDKRGLHTAA